MAPKTSTNPAISYPWKWWIKQEASPMLNNTWENIIWRWLLDPAHDETSCRMHLGLSMEGVTMILHVRDCMEDKPIWRDRIQHLTCEITWSQKG
jgi:hypothetical protein